MTTFDKQSLRDNDRKIFIQSHMQALLKGVDDSLKKKTGEKAMLERIANNAYGFMKNSYTEPCIQQVACDTFHQWRGQGTHSTVRFNTNAKLIVASASMRYSNGFKTPEEVSKYEEEHSSSSKSSVAA